MTGLSSPISNASFAARRAEKINGEIEKTRQQIESKTSRHFKTDQAYQNWKHKQFDKIAELEDELKMLQYPEDYSEMPIAVAAEELGLKPNQVSSLIAANEVYVSSSSKYTKQDFIHRDEISRILDYGVEKLLERGQQEPESIFAEAINYIHSNNLEEAEKSYERLTARDVTYSSRAESLETAINLLKGNLEDAYAIIQANFKYAGYEELTIYLTYLGRLVNGIHLAEHGAQALVEQILSITEKQTLNLYDWYESHKSKQIGKRLPDLQQRSMFLATAVFRSLKKYKHAQQFKFYNDRHSAIREEEFEGVIRNAIYTAIQAESTYEDSAASKMLVDILVSEIPRWYAPAVLVEHLPNEEAQE